MRLIPSCATLTRASASSTFACAAWSCSPSVSTFWLAAFRSFSSWAAFARMSVVGWAGAYPGSKSVRDRPKVSAARTRVGRNVIRRSPWLFPPCSRDRALLFETGRKTTNPYATDHSGRAGSGHPRPMPKADATPREWAGQKEFAEIRPKLVRRESGRPARRGGRVAGPGDLGHGPRHRLADLARDALPFARVPSFGRGDERRVLAQVHERRQTFEAETLDERAVRVDEHERLVGGVGEHAPRHFGRTRDAVRRPAVGVAERAEDPPRDGEPRGRLGTRRQDHERQVEHRRPVVERPRDALQACELQRRV